MAFYEVMQGKREVETEHFALKASMMENLI
jgi:hypothetical protein